VRIDASQAPQIVQQLMQEAVLRRLRPKV